MKITEKNHWYDSIIRPFNGIREEEETGHVSRRSQTCSVPTIALPLIEEWASPENYAV